MDDVSNVNETIENAQEDNNKMIDMIESKLLDLNLEKCCFLVAGNTAARK